MIKKVYNIGTMEPSKYQKYIHIDLEIKQKNKSGL